MADTCPCGGQPAHPTLGDHPHTDPDDGRRECDTCGKWVHLVIHSCKRVPVTGTAQARAATP